MLADRILRAGKPTIGGRDVEKPAGRTDPSSTTGLSPRAIFSWWTEGDDLVVSLISPNGPNTIIDALAGRRAECDRTPRSAMNSCETRMSAGFDRVGLAYFDMAAIPPLPRNAISLGLDRIKRLDYRWGFHGEAILSVLGADVPAPRTGIPAIFDQPTFDWRQLPPLPAGLADSRSFRWMSPGFGGGSRVARRDRQAAGRG